MDIFKQLYPGEPKSLKIRFTSENPFSFRFKRYVNGKAVCIGNGTKAITAGKDSKNNNTQIEVDCSEECEHRLSGKCKLKGSLKFELEGINAGGVWNLSTTGGSSLSNIASEIVKYKKAGMSIVGVPFELTLTEQQSLAYGTYYSIDLHRTDIKPELVGDIKPQLPEANSNMEEKKEKPKATEKKSEKKETEKAKIDSKKEVKQETDKNKEKANEKQEVDKAELDLSKQFAVKGFMPTLINGKKFDKVILQDTNCQDVEYILHPKANQEIIKCGAGTLIEIKETRMESDKNILCKYEILRVVAPDGSMTDYNTEELKEAV